MGLRIESLPIGGLALKTVDDALSPEDGALVSAVVVFVMGFMAIRPWNNTLSTGPANDDASHIKQKMALKDEVIRLQELEIEFLVGEQGADPRRGRFERTQDRMRSGRESGESSVLPQRAIRRGGIDGTRRFLDQQGEDRNAALAKVYASYGDLEHYDGHHIEAAVHFLNAAKLSPDDPMLINSAATCLADGGRYREAERWYKRAVSLSSTVRGAEHPDTVLCMEDHAALLRTLRRDREAKTVERRIRAIQEKQSKKE